jgi:4-amino-4-deoxy-L-arabinose transferase-like glycosyltransferase
MGRVARAAGTFRRSVTRRRAWVLAAAVAAAPRLIALAVERGDILESFTEKSDDFARAFVATGTFGMLPDVPSAYTQPLYGFFLAPIYWIFGRNWLPLGFAQIALACVTAILVYEIGRRLRLSPWFALIAAAATTLSPYLVWHDVHVNREIVDQPLAAGVVLTALVAADRRSWRYAVLAGALSGLAILGNTRLVFLPLVIAVWLLWRVRGSEPQSRRWLAPAAVILASTVVVLPWVVRNKAEVGCFAVTTDGRAFWKANNPQTYGLLTSGKWIDDVRRIPHSEYNPEEALALYRQRGVVYRPHECAQMRFYTRLARDWIADHPGEKAKLAQLAVRMEWDPRPTKTEGRPSRGGAVDTVRETVQPLYTGALFVLGIAGLWFAPRPFVVLALALLAYNTLAATAFVGATRYRVTWDFLIVLLAVCAAQALWERRSA